MYGLERSIALTTTYGGKLAWHYYTTFAYIISKMFAFDIKLTWNAHKSLDFEGFVDESEAGH